MPAISKVVWLKKSKLLLFLLWTKQGVACWCGRFASLPVAIVLRWGTVFLCSDFLGSCYCVCVSCAKERKTLDTWLKKLLKEEIHLYNSWINPFFAMKSRIFLIEVCAVTRFLFSKCVSAHTCSFEVVCRKIKTYVLLTLPAWRMCRLVRWTEWFITVDAYRKKISGEWRKSWSR